MERDNSYYIHRVKEILQEIRRAPYCNREIKPMVEDFFNKAISAVDKCERSNECYKIEWISIIVKNVTQNTRDYDKLSSKDLTFLSKIFDEIDILFARARMERSQSSEEEFNNQTNCINEIICKNMVGIHDCTEQEKRNCRDGMIFQNYEHLWKIVHRINTEWHELCSRGFSVKIFYDFWNFFKYSRSQGEEMTEGEKFETFMSILDGTMKFVPIYEYKPVCFKPVDDVFKGKIVKTIENEYSKPYRLRQKEEPISLYVTDCKN